MNIKALQQFADEILGQNRHTDSMNDYYPHTLYLDTEQNTYGDATRIALISTTDWSQDDCDTWETMTDSERNEYANDSQQPNEETLTPFMWQELSSQ